MGILPPGGNYTAERLRFEDVDLPALNRRALEDLRGNRIAMIFQDPMTSLNPVFTIGFQLKETFVRHVERDGGKAMSLAVELLEKVGISNAKERMNDYPHQLSGGMRQRVMIAMALICNPRLLIADEPTTALDVTIQLQILELLVELTREFGTGMLLITHDLGVVAHVANNVSVMYAGEVVESGPVGDVLGEPTHPYTQALLSCVPVPGGSKRGEHLGSIQGIVPPLVGDLGGCHFRARCERAQAACSGNAIPFHRIGKERGSRCVLAQSPAAAWTAQYA